MAKSKQKAVKTPKKRSTKYGKLAAVCSKELTAKKTALVRAEKALAKAQRTHTELLSEVARLDMLDRSLKALINGTEAPQNVRYVYSYPQWVWYGNPYWNGNTWTLSVGSPQTYVYNSGGLVGGNGNFQGGQFTTTNAINTTGAINCNTVTYPATSGNISVPNASSLTLDCSSSLGGLSLTNSGSSVLTSTASSSPAWQTVTTTPAPGELTIDLSTGATEEEPKAEESTDISACMNVKVVD
jgi:hypothetical protein